MTRKKVAINLKVWFEHVLTLVQVSCTHWARNYCIFPSVFVVDMQSETSNVDLALTKDKREEGVKI